MKHSIKIF